MKKKTNNPIVTLLDTVAYLHQKGYEKIRVLGWFAPSGAYYRISISSKKHFDNKTGYVLCKCDDDECYLYSNSVGFNFFKNESSYENVSIEEIGNRLLNFYPKIELEGKGDDKEYVSWFLELLKKVKNGKYPYAFDDYGYNIFKEGKILCSPGEDTLTYAPPGEQDYKESL